MVNNIVPSTAGTALLNFGILPGSSDTSVVVAESAVSAASFTEVWLRMEATADHSVDEIFAETISVLAGLPVSGVGFTVYGKNIGPGLIYGKFLVNWVQI